MTVERDQLAKPTQIGLLPAFQDQSNLKRPKHFEALERNKGLDVTALAFGPWCGRSVACVLPSQSH